MDIMELADIQTLGQETETKTPSESLRAVPLLKRKEMKKKGEKCFEMLFCFLQEYNTKVSEGNVVQIKNLF